MVTQLFTFCKMDWLRQLFGENTHFHEAFIQAKELPGQYPFTRGIYANMYQSKKWTMRQYAGFGSAKQTNARFHFLLDKGQMGLSIAFDLPTQLGLDSDHQLANGEVGKVGVAIDTLADMEALFDGIPLDQVSTSMTINAPAIVLLAMYTVLAERQGVSLTKLKGTIQNDLLKEYVARGTYIFPPQSSIRITTNILVYTHANMPKFKPISISGYHMREAGCTTAQELAFTFANAMTYLDAAIEAGIAVDEIVPKLSFFFSVHNHFFEEIAKLRAARRIWAKMMKEDYHAQSPESWKLKMHTQTAGSTLTKQEPYTNISRVAIQALAAVLGGTQSLHTNGYDEAIALPSEQSTLTALRTQQIIAHETGVIETPDPLGGSFYLEALTDAIEIEVVKYMQEIKEQGDMLAAIKNGYVENQIQDAAYEAQIKIENDYDDTGETFANDWEIDWPIDTPEIESAQIRQLQQLKNARDAKLVALSLLHLRKAAQDETINLFPVVVEAVKAYCTVGEICCVFREVFGEYRK
ncbi:methylmalonyl-CoA mutase [Radiobacillus sp. PE A8.2]|uniref:acyl-CoA mutase large subunit family protein n=1 Tax=Radiobacillus sp. PE A8.2 TaxID=3380349 RepID=UPI00388E53FF